MCDSSRAAETEILSPLRVGRGRCGIVKNESGVYSRTIANWGNVRVPLRSFSNWLPKIFSRDWNARLAEMNFAHETEFSIAEVGYWSNAWNDSNRYRNEMRANIFIIWDKFSFNVYWKIFVAPTKCWEFFENEPWNYGDFTLVKFELCIKYSVPIKVI